MCFSSELSPNLVREVLIICLFLFGGVCGGGYVCVFFFNIITIHFSVKFKFQRLC